MANFGATSLKKLEKVNPLLVTILKKTVQVKDCTIITGFRGAEAQNKAYESGYSKKKYPDSRHNLSKLMNSTEFSDAVDVAPWINGKLSEDVKECAHLAGIIIGIGAAMGITLRWGGNWDSDDEIMTDQTFQDLWHFELMGNL